MCIRDSLINNGDVNVVLVHIVNNFISGEDTLLFQNTDSLNGHFDEDVGVLTLTGTGSASEWQSAIRSVKYQNSSHNPEPSERLVEFTVNPGQPDTDSATRSISVSPVGPIDSSTGVNFNTDGGNNSYLLANDADAIFNGLTEFTAEVTYSTDNQITRSPLLSYHTSESNDTVSLQVLEDGGIFAEIMDLAVTTGPLTQQLQDGNRHSIALTWESAGGHFRFCLLYTSPSPRDATLSRMPSSA